MSDSSEFIELITSYEKKLTTAERIRDRAELSTLLSDDFSGVNMKGIRVNKESFIFGLCDSGIVFDSLEIENLDISHLSDIKSNILVHGISKFNITLPDGNNFNGSAEFADIWNCKNGICHLRFASVTPKGQNN